MSDPLSLANQGDRLAARLDTEVDLVAALAAAVDRGRTVEYEQPQQDPDYDPGRRDPAYDPMQGLGMVFVTDTPRDGLEAGLAYALGLQMPTRLRPNF